MHLHVPPNPSAASKHLTLKPCVARASERSAKEASEPGTTLTDLLTKPDELVTACEASADHETVDCLCGSRATDSHGDDAANEYLSESLMTCARMLLQSRLEDEMVEESQGWQTTADLYMLLASRGTELSVPHTRQPGSSVSSPHFLWRLIAVELPDYR